VKQNDFNMDMNGVLLNDSGKTKFLKHYEKKLMTTIKHRSLSRNVSYRRLIRLECYKLIKHLLGMEIYKPFVIWW
jgi:CRISPR-associated protein Cas1